MISLARQARQSVQDFAKKNSGAVIISVSLIIGLNLEKLTTSVTETIYHLSGQADADQRAYAAWGEKQERERNAQIELVKTMRAAWQAYMTAARTKFTQIKVVKNSYGGDYVCLQLSRQEETSAYQLRDSISDDFISWLNGNRLLGRVDWRYDELRAFDAQQYVNCLSLKDIWRANRYQQRID